MQNSPAQRRPATHATVRFLKAYVTTFMIIGSYLWLKLKARFFGQLYFDDRIDKLHRKNSRRIQETVLRLQGLFIKVGQLFSVMTNFLPEDFRTGLENLQDSVPAKPYEQIRTRIREELGKDPEDIFATFNEKPIASASLGQVHKATTHDGRNVAVKVQHLRVEDTAKADLKTIWRIIRIVRHFVRAKGLENYYTEVKTMILEELDFTKEAKHIGQIAANFEDNEKIRFPKVLEELSTSRVLTLEFVEGIKVTDLKSLRAAGLDPSKVARDLLTAYCQMVFVDGIYHADPHPGNILVQKDGGIFFLDFGAVGHLSTTMREGISSFLEAIIKGDEDQLLQSLRNMGFLRIGTDQAEAAAKVIEHFHRKFQEEIRLKDLSLSSIQIDTSRGLAHLADLKEMNVGLQELSSAFHMPKEWVLLERCTLLLTGLCTHLDPALNPAATIRPYLEEFVLGKDTDWSEMLFDVTREKVLSFLSLPKLLDKAVNKTLAGKVSFRIDGLSRAANLLYLATQQIAFTMLASVAAGVAVYFHHAGEPEWSRYAAYTGAGFVVLVLLSMLRSRKYRR